MKIECVVQMDSMIGESPVWDSVAKLLYWVDIAGKKIHTFDPRKKTNTTVELPEIVTSIALRKQGGLILTLRKDIALYDLESQKLTVLGTVEKDVAENRFNDGKCDRFGRFWAGTINGVHWKEASGTLYCLSSGFHPEARLEKAVCLNGLDWSPDNRTLYVTESFLYTIFAYDFDSIKGSLSNKRSFVSIPKDSKGFPDGLTVDSEGYVWSAETGAGRVVRYDPSGKVDLVINFPVPRVTSCCFGGDDLETLYVTSARETMTPQEIEQYPLSGSLFAVKTSVKGLPFPCFLG